MDRQVLEEIHNQVAAALEQASYRGRVSGPALDHLRAAPLEWKNAGGDVAGHSLLAKAQGLVGMLNTSPDDHPIRAGVHTDLRKVILDWRALGANLAV